MGSTVVGCGVSLHALPGGDRIAEGLKDLEAGQETAAALLVSVAYTRLRQLGVPVPATPFAEPELRLFRHLSAERPHGAYSRYNALLRSLTSFLHALEREAGVGIRARRLQEPALPNDG
jgi:hypothetical protein